MLFAEIIYVMLSMVKESTQNAPERVFPQLRKENPHMSRQAFSKARQKIKWEAFEVSVEGSYNEEYKLRRGFRVTAVDGSVLRLPSGDALLQYYGGIGNERGLTAPAALAPLLYDLENNIIVDAKIGPVRDNERALAQARLCALQGLSSYNRGHRELIIFDRGYPGYAFINSLPDKEIGYVIRMQGSFLPQRDMPKTKDGRITLGKIGRRVRVIQLVLSTGEVEMLITNLSESQMEYAAFGELYHKRWGIETKYKELKQKLETENFSGRLVDNVKQDFYAMMTVANMIASLVRQANLKAKKRRESQGNKYEYRVNVNHAIGVFKDRLIRVIIEEDRITRLYLMNDLVCRMERRVVPIRPNREVAREKHRRLAKFHLNHKSNC